MLVERLATLFKAHHVKFAIAGGWAVALHGAVRGTVDVDLVVLLTEQNLKNAEKALLTLGLKPRQPVTATDVFKFRQEYIKNRNMIAWSFVNHANPAEIVDILLPENLKSFSIVHKVVGSEKVPVVSVADLIRMKKESGRPQDLEDIRALKRLA